MTATPPRFVALTTVDGALIPVVPDFGSVEMKTASMTPARLLAVAKDAVLVSSITEVRLVVGEPTTGVAPSESERRVEAVAVVVQARINSEVVSLRQSRKSCAEMTGG